MTDEHIFRIVVAVVIVLTSAPFSLYSLLRTIDDE